MMEAKEKIKYEPLDDVKDRINKAFFVNIDYVQNGIEKTIENGYVINSSANNNFPETIKLSRYGTIPVNGNNTWIRKIYDASNEKKPELIWENPDSFISFSKEKKYILE